MNETITTFLVAGRETRKLPVFYPHRSAISNPIDTVSPYRLRSVFLLPLLPCNHYPAWVAASLNKILPHRLLQGMMGDVGSTPAPGIPIISCSCLSIHVVSGAFLPGKRHGQVQYARGVDVFSYTECIPSLLPPGNNVFQSHGVATRGEEGP